MNCQDCNKPLSAKRLAVKPTPRYCVTCQEFYDKRRPTDFHSSAFAVFAEPDEITRVREEGWNV